MDITAPHKYCGEGSEYRDGAIGAKAQGKWRRPPAYAGGLKTRARWTRHIIKDTRGPGGPPYEYVRLDSAVFV